MPLYRLTLEYRGTRYRGWQAQKNAPSVAAEVEKAARAVFSSVEELYGAGRTDAGVHALGQTAHLRAGRPRRPRADPRLALNDALPPDIAVLEARPAPQGFHARRSAVERVYLYQILRRRAALGGDLAWWVKDRLDVGAMTAAAAALRGRHDFASFCDRDPGKGAGTHADLRSLELAERGAMLLLRFRADRFLWKMVRRLTGFLVEAGRGRYRAQDASRLPARPSREAAPFTAPPCGLYLERVLYPGERFQAPPSGPLNLGLPGAHEAKR